MILLLLGEYALQTVEKHILTSPKSLEHFQDLILKTETKTRTFVSRPRTGHLSQDQEQDIFLKNKTKILASRSRPIPWQQVEDLDQDFQNWFSRKLET